MNKVLVHELVVLGIAQVVSKKQALLKYNLNYCYNHLAASVVTACIVG
ncbi:hypothetical protein [Candidatus Lariskella endosymbiont of Hedychridium roseum]